LIVIQHGQTIPCPPEICPGTAGAGNYLVVIPNSRPNQRDPEGVCWMEKISTRRAASGLLIEY